jgi:hypothetical protein
MGDLLRERLLARGWEILNLTPLPVICFTHREIREGRRTTAGLVAEVVGRGRAWISEVVLAGREKAIRSCITSFRTEEADLDVLLEELERALRS